MMIDSVALAIGLVGAVMNLGLVVVTLRRRGGGVDWGLMLAIAVLDAGCSLFLGLRVVVRWLDAAGANGAVWCGVGSLAMTAGLLMALFLAAMLSLVRYLVIVRGCSIQSQRVYGGVSLACLAIGLVHGARGATVAVVVYPSGLLCATQFWGYDLASQLFGTFNLAVYVGSLLLILVCYSLLSCRYYRIMRACNYRGMYTPAVGLALVALLYMAAMLPESVVFFLLHDPHSRRTLAMDAVTILPLAAIPTINAMYTLLLHEDTKRYVMESLLPSTPCINPYHTS